MLPQPTAVFACGFFTLDVVVVVVVVVFLVRLLRLLLLLLLLLLLPLQFRSARHR